MTRRPLLLLGALVAGLGGCASGGSPPGLGGVYTTPPPRLGAPPTAGGRDQATAVACRQEADRIVTFRDRGQLMREDERDARIGSEQNIYARRVETDRLGRLYERDRIAADCLRQTGRVEPAPVGSAPR